MLRTVIRVDVCTADIERRGRLKHILNDFRDDTEFPLEYRYFANADRWKKAALEQEPDFLILALDDIDSQETGLWLRNISKTTRIIWIAADKRFGLSAFRIGATDFILYPPSKEDIYDAMFLGFKELRYPLLQRLC